MLAMLVIPQFDTLYKSMSGTIQGLTSAGLAARVSFISVPASIIQVVFMTAAFVVLVKSILSTEGDTFPGMVVSFVKANARVFWVSILVMCGSFLATALGGVAKAQAQSAMVISTSLESVVVSIDIWKNKLVTNSEVYPNIAAAIMGSHSDLFPAGKVAEAISGGLTSELGKSSLDAVAGAAKKANVKLASLNTQLQNAQANGMSQAGIKALQGQVSVAQADANHVGGPGKLAKEAKMNLLKLEAQTSRLDADMASGAGGYIRAVGGAVADAGNKLTGWFGHHPAGALAGGVGVAGVVAIAPAAATIGGLVGIFTAITDVVNFIQAIPPYVVGYGCWLIQMVGLMVLAVTVMKESFAVLTYIAGFVMTVNFAICCAAPLAPVFLMTLLSDKYESYARTYFGFWMSMIFASAGLAAMARMVGTLINGIMATIGVEVGVGYLSVMGAHSVGDMFAGALMSCGELIVVGMCMSFVLDLVKRGASVGAGIWSGNFPT